jgi:hypothetical protein
MRPMHYVNVPAHRHKQYIDRHRDDYRQKYHRASIPTRHILESFRHNTNTSDTMSTAIDDRNNNSIATAPVGGVEVGPPVGAATYVDFTSTLTPNWPSHNT